jgi:hypothetical protein
MGFDFLNHTRALINCTTIVSKSRGYQDFVLFLIKQKVPKDIRCVCCRDRTGGFYCTLCNDRYIPPIPTTEIA